MTNMKPVKIFDWFTRLLPLWVVLCGIIAYFWPFVFIPLKSYLELAFALTMLGIGLVNKKKSGSHNQRDTSSNNRRRERST
ncbi:MAG: hypothetical protein JRC57_05750 [Deltaproteobacteria bacterium]|nr:hypothetical protein [Deltaproteobacteria bacterium]